MNDQLRPIDPEELLAHSGWMRALARGLVRDDATAEDLVQEAYAVALARPPRDPKALPAWLVRVMRNLAARSFRDEARREKREARVARPEGDDPPLDDLVERAELQRAVMEAVLALDEPFRSTVLLRYFEERSPEEVARRLGVPVATVGTRLHRALEKLRARLDREQGGRSAWVAILAPWVGLTTALGVASGAAAAEVGSLSASPAGADLGSVAGGGTTGGVGPSAGTASSAGSGGVGAGGGGAVPSAAAAESGAALAGPALITAGGQAVLGGVVVMQKTFIVSVLAGAICSAIGFGIGRTTSSESVVPEGQRIIEESEYSALLETAEEEKVQRAAVEVERETLRQERDALKARVATVEADLARAATPSATESSDAEFENASTLVVSFGEWGDLPAIRNANWPELGDAVSTINELVAPLYDDILAGGPVSPKIQKQISDENNKLVNFGLSLHEKIPSNSPVAVNGEFTHPISLINLIASMLDEAGAPLTGSQREELAVIGNQYDRDFHALEAGYSESTWELSKIVDELSLKRDTMLQVEEKLTPQQRDIVMIPRIQNRIRLDTLSPVNMVVMNVGTVLVDSPDEVVEEVTEQWVDNIGIDVAAFQENLDLLERYRDDVAEILTPISRESAPFIHLDDIIIAGRAQERVLIDLAARSNFSEELNESLRVFTGWAVPQVALPASETSNP